MISLVSFFGCRGASHFEKDPFCACRAAVSVTDMPATAANAQGVHAKELDTNSWAALFAEPFVGVVWPNKP